MNDDYRKLSELLDNWLSDNEKEIKLALIEKEILLEKVRKLYVKLSAMETEEYAAPQQEVANPEPKRKFTPANGMEEDVDLFFDTEHESYQTVEQDLEEIAQEISEAQDKPGTPKTEPKKTEPDIFDQIEEKQPTEQDDDEPMTDDAGELFIETDFVISSHPETIPEKKEEPAIEATPTVVEKETSVVEGNTSDAEEIQTETAIEDVEEDNHEEDDILQFITPKSAPDTSNQTPTPTSTPKATVTDKPQQIEEQPKSEQIVEERPTSGNPPQKPKPQQRSLNDLFNERREDHSISSQYQHARVGDLTKAISISDKFIYIKELFHNRGEDFSAAIRQLNECKNMEEAFDCLDKLKQKYFWDSKSDAYLSFCDLLRRKFS